MGVCHTETLKNVESKVALTRYLTDPLPVQVVDRLTDEAPFVSQQFRRFRRLICQPDQTLPREMQD